MWAVKILDVTPEADAKQRLTLFPWLGLEVGLYGGFGFTSDLVGLIQGRPEQSKILHLPHQSVSLTRHCAQTLAYNVRQAEILGVRRVIIHAPVEGMRTSLTPQEAADRMAALTERYPGVTFMLENTWESLAWWANYLALRPLGGMVLDIGHARALSADAATLPAWVDLLLEAHVGGRSVHCHIHGNDGSDDQHECLAVASRRG